MTFFLHNRVNKKNLVSLVLFRSSSFQANKLHVKQIYYEANY